MTISFLYFLLNHFGFLAPECICVPILDSEGKEIVKNYDSIFKGKVNMIDSITYVWRVNNAAKDSLVVSGILVTLNVEKVWRGKIDSNTVKIITGDGGGDCGYYFKVDSQYIVFAELGHFEMVDSIFGEGRFLSHHEHIYTTNDCDKTTDDVKKMEAVLDSVRTEKTRF